MLNLIRDTLKYSKWILLFIVVSFVLFYGVDWTQRRDRSPHGEQWIARVDGKDVDALLWQQQYRRLDDQYRRMFGKQYDQVRKSLDLPRQAVEQVIQTILILRDAQRLGLSVSNEELSAVITTLPDFQRNGAFIGAQAYQDAFRRGMVPQYRSAEDFEAFLHDQLIVMKWRSLLQAATPVSDDDVAREYQRRHEKATFDYIALPVSKFVSEAKPTDADLETWYRAHVDRFGRGEGRRLIYVLADDAAVADQVKVSDQEIEDYYNTHLDEFKLPEMRRARHILIKVAADADAATVEKARQKTQELADKARAGADFAQLASQSSEDEGTKAKGGDLGFFARGRMVPEFDEAVFSQNVGVVSDPVRSSFGFHVIKVEAVNPAGTQPLANVRQQIAARLRFPRLRDAEAALAAEFRRKAVNPTAFRETAQQMKLRLREAGVLLRGDNVPSLGPEPEMLEAAFTLPKDGISDPISLSQGAAVVLVQDIVPDYVPPLATRKERVLADYQQEHGKDQARTALATALARAGGDLARAAKDLKVEVKKTEPAYTRGAALGGAPADPALDQAAFSTPIGADSAVIATPQAAVVLHVISREQPDPTGLPKERTEIKDALAQPLLQELLQQKLSELRKAAKIELNIALLEKTS